MNDLLSHLNEEQRKAVQAPLGPVLVLAGAGSGKTRVLTYRIAWLLEQKLFKPEDLLALTFTNKAAGEMKDRIQRLVPELVEGRPSTGSGTTMVTMGTFHSVCVRILRQDIEQLKRGYSRNFVIYDEEDKMRLLKHIVLELGLAEAFRPQVFAYYISMAKNRLLDPSSLELDNPYLENSLEDVFARYQRQLIEHNALDFDDLLALVCELFVSNKKSLKKYQQRFKYVLVDEYQDTNHAQYVMLRALVREHHNIFVVGDDAQSIYGFRGANMQNILDYKKDYPKAKIYMLEQNYRSTQPILDVAHKVIRLNPFQYEKKLWTQNREGERVNLYEAQNEMDEAEFVIKRIMNYEVGIRDKSEELVYESEGTPILNRFLKKSFRPSIIPTSQFLIPNDLNDIVILYRTHAQSRPFEELLVTTGVPYQIVGGVKFYERKEIKDILAYLRLVLNPKDLVSLARVINTPARGIGPAGFKAVVAALKKYEFNFGRLLNNLEALDLPAKTGKGVEDFFSLLLTASRLPKTKSLPELMHLVLERSGYKESLLAEGEEGEGRLENVEELFNVAAKYRGKSWLEGLSAFLEETSLMMDIDSLEDNSNKLTLMTLHSAKGLEFEQVFFVGLEEGLLPHSRSLLNPAEIAEEIRLAYVGITRAKKNLYLSFARQRQHYGETKQCIPSRVIDAIPKRLLRKLN